MKTVTVEVKQKHIDRKGVTRDERDQVCDCMVAAALNDIGWTKIRCGSWTLGGTFRRKRFENVSIPYAVTNKITQWLMDKPVKPFSFRLRYEG